MEIFSTMGDGPEVFQFNSFGQQIEFIRDDESYGIVRDGASEPVSAEEWDEALEQAFESKLQFLDNSIHDGEATLDDYADEHDWSSARWISELNAGIDMPSSEIYTPAEEALSKLSHSIQSQNWSGAYDSLLRAETELSLARSTWAEYRTSVESDAMALAQPAQDLKKGLLKGGSAAAALAVAPVVVPLAAGGAVLLGASSGVATVVGVGSGMVAGGAAGGTVGAVTSFVDDLIHDTASSDQNFTATVISESMWEGVAIGGAAVPGAGAFWQRFATIGGASAAARVGYDVVDGVLRDEQKNLAEIASNAAKALIGGGLCAGPATIFKGAVAYNYIALDLLGDVSAHYFPNIRERMGDEAGITITAGTLLAEGVLAANVFVKLGISWPKAIISVVVADGVSMAFETSSQLNSGRELSDLDVGRFVGMFVWGHAVVALPTIVVNGTATVASGLAANAAATMEYGLNYIFFVNPSVSNFQARVNGQNWENVLIGNTLRQSTVMWLSRIVQALLGPSNVLAMGFDEFLGWASHDGVNRLVPYYEGIPEIWFDSLLTRIRSLDIGNLASFDGLTDFFTRDIGAVSVTQGFEYMPSELNLQVAKEILDTQYKNEPEIQRPLSSYVEYLGDKGILRTPQEELIYKHLSDSSGQVVLSTLPSLKSERTGHETGEMQEVEVLDSASAEVGTFSIGRL